MLCLDMKNRPDRIEDKSEFQTKLGRLTETIGYNDDSVFLSLSLPTGESIDIDFRDFMSGLPNHGEPSEMWAAADEVFEVQLLSLAESMEGRDEEEIAFEDEALKMLVLTKLRAAYRQARNDQ